MRVFITGATGAIGHWLIPQLKERGHEIVASVRSPAKGDRLRAMGVESVIVDLLDPEAVRLAVCASRPDAIIHEATALGGVADLKHFDRSFARTNELRTRATDHLVAAARASGVRRLVAQSYTGWPYGRGGAPIKTEDDPLDPYPLPVDARVSRRDQAPRARGRRRGRDRAALRRVLRRARRVDGARLAERSPSREGPGTLRGFPVD